MTFSLLQSPGIASLAAHLPMGAVRPWGLLPVVFMGSVLETGAHLLAIVCRVTMAIGVIKVNSFFLLCHW